MSAATRIAWLLEVKPVVGRILMLSALLVLAGGVGLATRLSLLPLALFGSVVALAFVVSLRWPLAPLLAFAALIPIEEIVIIPGVGTLSRLAGLTFAAAYALPRLRSLQLRAMPAAGWAFVAWAGLSLTWAIDRSASSAQLGTLVQLFAIAVLVAEVVSRRPAVVRPLLWTYTISTGVAAALGVALYVTAGVGGTRVAIFADQNADQYATLLLPGLIFAMFEVSEGRRVALASVVALLTTAAVILSGTRGAWVAAAAAILFVLIPSIAPRKRLVAGTALFAVVGAALLLPGALDLVLRRIELAGATGGAGRTEIWTVGLTIYSSAPILGVGYGNFPIAYTPEVIRASAVGEDATRWYGSGAHNIIIGTLGELGIVGFVALAVFVAWLMWRRLDGEYGPAVKGMLVSLLASAMFLDVFNRKQVWLVIGVAAGLGFLARRRAVLEDPVPDQPVA